MLTSCFSVKAMCIASSIFILCPNALLVRRSSAFTSELIMSDPLHATAYTGFVQSPPTFHNPFTSDPLLHRILRRRLDPHLLATLTPTFTALGDQAISPQTLAYVTDANRNLPSVIHWDGWGVRKDTLQTSEGWRKLKGLWASSGMMEDIYLRPHGCQSRIVAFTKYHDSLVC
jgi:hypothetical protein